MRGLVVEGTHPGGDLAPTRQVVGAGERHVSLIPGIATLLRAD